MLYIYVGGTGLQGSIGEPSMKGTKGDQGGDIYDLAWPSVRVLLNL